MFDSSGHEGTPVSDHLVRLRCWRRLRYVACLTLAAGCGHAVASIPPAPPPAPRPNADSLAAADRSREEADRRARQRAADSAAALAGDHRPAGGGDAGPKARPPSRAKRSAAKPSARPPSAVDVAQSRLSPGQVRYTGPDTMVVDSSVQ